MMLLTDPADVQEFSFNIRFDTQFVTVDSVSFPERATGYEQPLTSPISIDNSSGIVGLF
jgi:hypothetical protein